jgi:NADPH:quinone reductase
VRADSTHSRRSCRIPGNGVGGVVSSVGAGADGDLIGKRVVSGTGGSGGYAERVAVNTGGLFEVPDGLDLDRAVALLADGRTATMLVRKAGLFSISGAWRSGTSPWAAC